MGEIKLTHPSIEANGRELTDSEFDEFATGRSTIEFGRVSLEAFAAKCIEAGAEEYHLAFRRYYGWSPLTPEKLLAKPQEKEGKG